jgi:hypothetical protein
MSGSIIHLSIVLIGFPHLRIRFLKNITALHSRVRDFRKS